jgi:DNA invertase Pin-like site-specific DNA recombinase
MAGVQKSAKGRYCARNDMGRPIGETHPMAKLSDKQVDQMHALREQGMGVSAIARQFKISKSQAWKILEGHSRGQWAARWVFEEGQ